MGNKNHKKDKSIIFAEIVNAIINGPFNDVSNRREMTAGQIFDAVFKDDNDEGGRFTLEILYKHLKQMVEEEHILVKRDTKTIEGDKYSLNDEFFIVDGIKDDRMESLLLYFLRHGKLRAYKDMRIALNRKRDTRIQLPNDNEQIAIYERSIRDEDVKTLSIDKNAIRVINQAFEEDRLISFSYHGKQTQGDPLCYVVGRTPSRTYLYMCQKKQAIPYRLEEIEGIPEIGEVSRLPYQPELLEEIKKQWDIGNDQGMVKLLFLDVEELRRDPEYIKAQRELDAYFEKKEEYEKKGFIYQGEMIGISGFIPWVREHAEYCILLEPKNERDRLIDSLKVRKERYS